GPGAGPALHRGVRRQLQGVRPGGAPAHRVGPRQPAARAGVVADAGGAGAVSLDPGARLHRERAARRPRRADVAGGARGGADPRRAPQGPPALVGVQAPLRAPPGGAVLPLVRAQPVPARLRRPLHLPRGAAGLRRGAAGGV
ncbi:MAG: hypothetical protein AVDCRST_MAG40-775, partial [uncultured Gemmatimonadaceae bacterium]